MRITKDESSLVEIFIQFNVLCPSYTINPTIQFINDHLILRQRFKCNSVVELLQQSFYQRSLVEVLITQQCLSYLTGQ